MRQLAIIIARWLIERKAKNLDRMVRFYGCRSMAYKDPRWFMESVDIVKLAAFVRRTETQLMIERNRRQ